MKKNVNLVCVTKTGPLGVKFIYTMNRYKRSNRELETSRFCSFKAGLIQRTLDNVAL